MSPLAAAYVARSDFPPCAYAEVSPGVGWLVGRELVQILGARLLVSALRMGRVTRNLDSIMFYIYENLRNFYGVIFSTVINVAFYDVFSFSYNPV